MEDEDRTSPEILGGAEEPTKPGIGAGDGYIAASGLAARAFTALRTLEDSCPQPGAPSFRRHLELIAHAWGELGDLCHDERRLTLHFIRERITR